MGKHNKKRSINGVEVLLLVLFLIGFFHRDFTEPRTFDINEDAIPITIPFVSLFFGRFWLHYLFNDRKKLVGIILLTTAPFLFFIEWAIIRRHFANSDSDVATNVITAVLYLIMLSMGIVDLVKGSKQATRQKN